MLIRILDIVRTIAITLQDGETAHALIHPAVARGETVILDFAGVDGVAPPFLNPAIGWLYRDFAPETIDRLVQCINLNERCVRMLARIKENAAEYWAADPATRDRIDAIVARNAGLEW